MSGLRVLDRRDSGAVYFVSKWFSIHRCSFKSLIRFDPEFSRHQEQEKYSKKDITHAEHSSHPVPGKHTQRNHRKSCQKAEFSTQGPVGVLQKEIKQILSGHLHIKLYFHFCSPLFLIFAYYRIIS